QQEWPVLNLRAAKETAPARGRAEAVGDVSKWGDRDTLDNPPVCKPFPSPKNVRNITAPLVFPDCRDLKTRPRKRTPPSDYIPLRRRFRVLRSTSPVSPQPRSAPNASSGKTAIRGARDGSESPQRAGYPACARQDDFAWN